MVVFFSPDDRQEYFASVISIGFEIRARFSSMVSDEQSRLLHVCPAPLGTVDFLDQLEIIEYEFAAQ